MLEKNKLSCYFDKTLNQFNGHTVILFGWVM